MSHRSNRPQLTYQPTQHDATTAKINSSTRPATKHRTTDPCITIRWTSERPRARDSKLILERDSTAESR